jgi:two-component system sensor histidine kinase TctE
MITARVVADPFGEVLVLQVEDSGPGIPPAERELVLQPFYRALGTQVDGSGLGLPIVNEIMKQHQGEIQIEAVHPGAPMPGTRISLRFRIRAAQAAA